MPQLSIIFRTLHKLNCLQWEAMILVTGERCFVDLGPIEAFDSYMAQPKMQEAVYLVEYSLGDVDAILSTAKTINGPAVEELYCFRLNKALKGVGARERAQLGVLAHLLLLSRELQVLEDDAPCSKPVGTSTGVGMGLQFNLAWIDMVIGFPEIMMQKFGVAYTFLIPDLSAKRVAEDPTIMNVLRVACKKEPHPCDWSIDSPTSPHTNTLFLLCRWERRSICSLNTGSPEVALSFWFPQPTRSSPRSSLKGMTGSLSSLCSNENYLMIIKNLHEMAGGMSTHPTQAELSDGWTPGGMQTTYQGPI